MPELNGLTLLNDANIKAYYRCESGALVTDTKGAYTLTNNNSVAEATGKFGGGGSTGTGNTNKHLQVLNDMGIAAGAISIVGWFNINQAPSNETFCLAEQCDAGTHVSNELQYVDSGGTKSLRASRVRLGAATDNTSYTVDLGTATWHHIAYTYDATNVRIYLNGSLVGGPSGSTGNGTASGQDDFTIGCRGTQETETNFADITFDDIAVFNDALSGNEILSLYRAGARNFGYIL